MNNAQKQKSRPSFYYLILLRGGKRGRGTHACRERGREFRARIRFVPQFAVCLRGKQVHKLASKMEKGRRKGVFVEHLLGVVNGGGGSGGGTVICRCVSSTPTPFPHPSYSSFDKQGLATWLQPLAHLFSVPPCFFLPLLSVRRKKKNLAKSFFPLCFFFFSHETVGRPLTVRGPLFRSLKF